MKIINESSFAGSHNGKVTGLYTLRNANELVVQITNYGAIIVSIFVPDRKGVMADIVQGYDNIRDYVERNSPYMGAICGRCANRIGKGSFTIGDNDYKLAVNNGPNHLHGGIKGFNKAVWDVIESSESYLTLGYLSPDGEEGYPGNLTVKVKYTLTDKNELRLDYHAVTDKTTVVNIASHSYFNLAGEGSGPVYDQLLKINGRFFTPTDEYSLPTGEIRPVKGTPMDFTEFRRLGEMIDSDNEQLRYGAGYDHNWVLDHFTGVSGLAAIAHDPSSGRLMEVYTTQPGLQLYTANWIDNEAGKGKNVYQRRWAFCLETQHFANAVNIPHFPTVILKPGETYSHTTIHKFDVK